MYSLLSTIARPLETLHCWRVGHHWPSNTTVTSVCLHSNVATYTTNCNQIESYCECRSRWVFWWRLKTSYLRNYTEFCWNLYCLCERKHIEDNNFRKAWMSAGSYFQPASMHRDITSNISCEPSVNHDDKFNVKNDQTLYYKICKVSQYSQIQRKCYEVSELHFVNVTVVMGISWFSLLTAISLITCYVISWITNSLGAEIKCSWTTSFEYIATARMPVLLRHSVDFWAAVV